jgi:AraC-like DNA-binding protein
MRLFSPEELIKCDMLDDPVSAILEGTGMIVRCPSLPLATYLGCFWAFPAEPPASVKTLPDGCAQFVVEWTGGASPAAFIGGPRSHPSHYRKPPLRKIIGVRLRPGVGYLLLRRPMCDLVNRRVRVAAPELTDRMARTHSVDERFDVLESHLSRKLAGLALDDRVRRAIRAVGESAGGARIDEVARQCGVSRRHLERLMRVWVGVSPKRLARVARFQALLGSVQNDAQTDWTERAAASYADQSHLIHEFAEFAGASPRRFYAEQRPDALPARCG